VFLDSERARLQAAKAALMKRSAMRRTMLALEIAQMRAKLHGTADMMKTGMTVAETVMRFLTRDKRREP